MRSELRPHRLGKGRAADDDRVLDIWQRLQCSGGLAAVMLKNTVHCALAVTVAFARAGAAVSATRRAVRGIRADPGVHRRGGDSGGIRDFAHAGFGDAEGRRFQQNMVSGFMHCGGGLCGAGMGGDSKRVGAAATKRAGA